MMKCQVNIKTLITKVYFMTWENAHYTVNGRVTIHSLKHTLALVRRQKVRKHKYQMLTTVSADGEIINLIFFIFPGLHSENIFIIKNHNFNFLRM